MGNNPGKLIAVGAATVLVVGGVAVGINELNERLDFQVLK